MSKTYYQPISKDAFCELPFGLASFEVFETIEECTEWLKIHDEEISEYSIVEYHDDDIEKPTFIDRYDFPINEVNERHGLGEPITKDYYKDTPTSDLFAIVAEECSKETILSVAEGYVGCTDTEIREFLFACLGLDIE